VIDPKKDDIKSKHLIPLTLAALTEINNTSKFFRTRKYSTEEMYSLCKCGSGKKFKFCCYKKR